MTIYPTFPFDIRFGPGEQNNIMPMKELKAYFDMRYSVFMSLKREQMFFEFAEKVYFAIYSSVFRL